MRPGPIVAGTLAAALVVGGVAFASRAAPRTPSYSTANVVSGTVTQTLVASGPVTRPGQATLSFDTPGTVSSLSVRLGDAVTKGQRLANVDPAPLQVSVLQAQAALGQARAVLDADQTALDNGGSVAAVPATSTTTTPSRPQATTPAPSVPAQQPAYLTALTASMAGLQQSVAAQQAACAPIYAAADKLSLLGAQLPTTLPTALPTQLPATHPTTSATPSALPTALPTGHNGTLKPGPGAVTPSPTPSPEPTVSPSPTVMPTPSPSPTASPTTPRPTLSAEEAKRLAAQLAACATTTVALATAEQTAGSAIFAASAGMQADTLAAQQQLAAGQQQLAASTQAAAQQAATQAIAQAQAQLAAQAQRALGSRVTDATIAADRARVLQAEQALARAQRALDAAQLTSPVDGTVGALNLVAGESSAGRSATIVGPGAAEVAIEVPLSARALVTVGQAASVGLVGADAGLTGQVTSVSVLPTSASGQPTYTATIGVDDPGMTLYSGAKALVTLDLRTATDVLTVPVSAVVKVTDTSGTVQVVPDAYATGASRVDVVTGAVGGGRIEVVSGLRAGQVVVLADRRLPVPGGLQQYQPATPTPSASATPGR